MAFINGPVPESFERWVTATAREFERDLRQAWPEVQGSAEARRLSLQFKGDVLIGATSIGLTQHVGALRGLIHGQVRLGDWKDRLLANPLSFVDAYVARSQQPMALAR